MIDYRSHLVALSRFRSDLGAELFSEPAMDKERLRLLAEVDQERGLAALGSLIDHLLHHAASDGQELAVLERAAQLWNEGIALYTSLGENRSSIETALLNPADPDAANRFNNALESVRLLGLNASGKLGEVEALRVEVMKLAHIRKHPRQLDQKLLEWNWGDLFLARRTDAFVRNAFQNAEDPLVRSFAFGVLSSYSANACGSAYLQQVVGGPRRSHRFRDRIARNTVGSWFAQIHPEVNSLASIANQLRFGPDPAAPTLPAKLEAFILETLRGTYDLNLTGPLPNLQTGYARLVRHLELLDVFTLPPPPLDPATPFLAALYGDPSNPPSVLFTLQAANFPAGPGQGSGGTQPTNYSGAGNTPTPNDSAPNTGERCGSFWMGLMYALMFLGGGFAPCIGAWAQGDRCKLWDAIWKEFGDANKPSQEQMDALASQSSPLTSAEFVAAAGVDQMVKLVGYMFDLQGAVWEALGKALGFLAIHGLIYPDTILHNPVYRQFLTIPTAVNLPLLPEKDARSNFYRYPPTLGEQPTCGWAPYPTGASPNVFIGPSSPGSALPNASGTAIQIWRQVAASVVDATNFDLDADRGFHFPCWATQGSIRDVPVGSQFLNYEEM